MIYLLPEFCLLLLLGTCTLSSDGAMPEEEDAADYYDEGYHSRQGMHELLTDLFEHYDKELMPARPVYVKLDVLLLKVNTTVEKDGTFETVIAVMMQWFDGRLRWDPADFDNVTVLAIDSKKVWLPDVAMTNSADHLYEVSRDTQFVVRLTYDGTFKFVPTGIARTWCDLSLVTFPFDFQTCSMEFESWSLDASTMIFNETSSISVDPKFLSTQWTLCNETVKVYQGYYKISGETFSRVKFTFTIHRKSTFYLVQNSSTDRISFGTVNLLCLIFFHSAISQEMPRSDAVTVLSKYVITLVLMAAVGIYESVVIERLSLFDDDMPPAWLLSTARVLLKLFRRIDVNTELYDEMSESSTTSSTKRQHNARVPGRVTIAESPSNASTLSTLSASFRRRKLSCLGAAMVVQERRNFHKRHFRKYWRQVAAALNVICFVFCFIVAFVVPLALFLPVANFGEDCLGQ